MAIRLGVIMDPVHTIHYQKDTTLALLQEAQQRGYQIIYFEQADIYLKNGIPFGVGKTLTLSQDPTNWYTLGPQRTLALTDLDVILMRKDPPFNAEYIYSTYILEQAEYLGVKVFNRPQALRDANEKLFTLYFRDYTPPHVVTRSLKQLQDFLTEYGDIVVKPLDVMGGVSIFRLRKGDVNTNVTFEVLTQQGTRTIIAQQFIPAITEGDKRILLIDGKPYPHVLYRVPQGEDWRGNLAVGAKGIVKPLTERDRFISETVGKVLREKGLLFVGIDVIGDYLTEINVTSPTGIREIEKATQTNVSALVLTAIEKKLH